MEPDAPLTLRNRRRLLAFGRARRQLHPASRASSLQPMDALREE